MGLCFSLANGKSPVHFDSLTASAIETKRKAFMVDLSYYVGGENNDKENLDFY